LVIFEDGYFNVKKWPISRLILFSFGASPLIKFLPLWLRLTGGTFGPGAKEAAIIIGNQVECHLAFG